MDESYKSVIRATAFQNLMVSSLLTRKYSSKYFSISWVYNEDFKQQ